MPRTRQLLLTRFRKGGREFFFVEHPRWFGDGRPLLAGAVTKVTADPAADLARLRAEHYGCGPARVETYELPPAIVDNLVSPRTGLTATYVADTVVERVVNGCRERALPARGHWLTREEALAESIPVSPTFRAALRGTPVYPEGDVRNPATFAARFAAAERGIRDMLRYREWGRLHADEVVSDTLHTALRYLDFLDDGRNVEAWLMETARRLSRDGYRRDRRLRFGDDALGSAVARAERADETAAAERYLGMLSPANADLVRAYFLDGLSAADVGRGLGISEQAVRTRVSRAVADLRARLAPSAQSEKFL